MADNHEVARPDPHVQSDPAHKDEAQGGAAAGRGPLIHVATRCTSVDEFVEKFASFASEGSLVLPASGDLPIGTEGRFVILLRDRSVAMRGRCRVTDAKPAPHGVSGAGVRRTMLRVVLLEMDDATRAIHQRLLAGQRPPVPIMVAQSVSEPTEVSPPRLERSPGRGVVPPPIPVRPVIAPPVSAFAKTTIAPLASPPLRSVAPPAPPLQRAAPAAPPTPQAPDPRAPAPQAPAPQAPARETTARGPAPSPLSVSPRPAPSPPPVSARSAPTQTSGTPAGAARPAPAASAYARAPTLIGVPSSRSADSTPARGDSHDETITAVAAPSQEARVPGASFTLPANPLSELGPEDLASFIDCTLFEADAAEAEAAVVDDAGPTAEIDPLAPARPFVIPGPSAEELLAPAPPLAAAKTGSASAGKERALRLARRYGIPAGFAVGALLIGLAIPRPGHVRRPAAPPAPAPAARAAEAPAAQPAPEIRPAQSAPVIPAAPPAAEAVAAKPAARPAAPLKADEQAAEKAKDEAPKAKAVAKAEAKAAKAEAKAEEQAETKETAEVEKPAPVAKAAPAAAARAGGGSCVVRVVSEPSDARVTWGDKLIGVTPIDAARVPCGTASVTFHRDRYQPVTRDLVANADETTAVSQKLHRPAATLVVGSSPPHAEITVNGQSQGFTPKRISVSRFESVTIRVALTGYAPWKKTVYVREAETRLGTTLVHDGGKRAGR